MLKFFFNFSRGASIEDVFPSSNDSVIIEAGNLENKDDTDIMKGEEMPVDLPDDPGELDGLYDFDLDLDLNSDFDVVSVPQECAYLMCNNDKLELYTVKKTLAFCLKNRTTRIL